MNKKYYLTKEAKTIRDMMIAAASENFRKELAQNPKALSVLNAAAQDIVDNAR